MPFASGGDGANTLLTDFSEMLRQASAHYYLLGIIPLQCARNGLMVIGHFDEAMWWDAMKALRRPWQIAVLLGIITIRLKPYP